MKKKNLLAILMAGIMLATMFSAISVIAADNTHTDVSNVTNSGTPDTTCLKGSLTVYVYDIDPPNHPVVGATVTATSFWFPWYHITLSDNGDGYYNTQDIRIGYYLIYATAPGYYGNYDRGTVHYDQDTFVPIFLFPNRNIVPSNSLQPDKTEGKGIVSIPGTILE